MERAMRFVFLCVALAGCSAGTSGVKAAPGPSPGPAVVIEESDLYRQDGAYLYVQNAQTGLNVLDVGDPRRPTLLARAPVLGAGGELYLHKGYAAILLREASGACAPPADVDMSGWSAATELAMVDLQRPWRPRLGVRFCLPGQLVASRLVNDFLFIAVNRADADEARLLSVDLADPAAPVVIDELFFPGASKEIHVTETAIFVAERAPDGYSTVIQYVELSATEGWIRKRGSLTVPGEPQGRFQMDLAGATFRIVTFETRYQSSRLSVIDVAKPDSLRLVGALAGIGYGERLYATRFDGDRAYVVTFRQSDPLWVISLADPSAPQIVGSLFVPGWSDYLYVRGERLLAVGRGSGGSGVQVSLFDVSDPRTPGVLGQVQLGGSGATSEANSDFRGVTVVERDGASPYVVVPYGFDVNGCTRAQAVQLVDLDGPGLRIRGFASQNGRVRRTLLVDETLLSISNYELLALDVSDRDRLSTTSQVTLGTEDSFCAFDQYVVDLRDDVWEPRLLCSGGGSGSPVLGALLVVALFALALRRRAAKELR